MITNSIIPEQNEKYYFKAKKRARQDTYAFIFIFGFLGNLISTMIHATVANHLGWVFPITGLVAVLVLAVILYPFRLRSSFKRIIEKNNKPATRTQMNKILRLAKREPVFKPVFSAFIADKGAAELTYGEYVYLLNLKETICEKAKMEDTHKQLLELAQN
jgi:hypothetical protein